MVALAWVGYDQPRSLGERETGGGLALPIWIDFMQEALKKVPVSTPEMPAGVMRINGEFYTARSAPGVGVPRLGLEDPVTMEELLLQKGQAGQTGN
jgi:penicillin-binding protein 1A